MDDELGYAHRPMTWESRPGSHPQFFILDIILGAVHLEVTESSGETPVDGTS